MSRKLQDSCAKLLPRNGASAVPMFNANPCAVLSIVVNGTLFILPPWYYIPVHLDGVPAIAAETANDTPARLPDGVSSITPAIVCAYVWPHNTRMGRGDRKYGTQRMATFQGMGSGGGRVCQNYISSAFMFYHGTW